MLRLRLIALSTGLRNFHQRGFRSAVHAFVTQDFDVAKFCYMTQGLGDLHPWRKGVHDRMRVVTVALAQVRTEPALDPSAGWKTQVNKPSKLIPPSKGDLWESHAAPLQCSHLTATVRSPSRKLSFLDRAREQIQ